jgi:hypothetical protein
MRHNNQRKKVCVVNRAVADFEAADAHRGVVALVGVVHNCKSCCCTVLISSESACCWPLSQLEAQSNAKAGLSAQCSSTCTTRDWHVEVRSLAISGFTALPLIAQHGCQLQLHSFTSSCNRWLRSSSCLPPVAAPPYYCWCCHVTAAAAHKPHQHAMNPTASAASQRLSMHAGYNCC